MMERTPNHPTVIDGLRRAGAGGRMIEARKLGVNSLRGKAGPSDRLSAFMLRRADLPDIQRWT